MRNIVIPIALTALLATVHTTATAGVTETAAQEALEAAMPANTGFGAVKVNKVSVDPGTKTVTVDCNEAASYIPLTADSYAALKKDLLSRMGQKYAGYNLVIESNGKKLRDLVLFSDKKNQGPTETGRFITYTDREAASKGLDGANIAMWQSHGWYYEPKLNRWEWQRARIFETVEDLYTQSYVVPYLMPMLENAGAYVMSPRDRDMSSVEAIIDDGTPDFTTTGNWSRASVTGFGHDGKLLTEGVNPFENGFVVKANTSDKEKKAATATWHLHDQALAGRHAIYVSYASLPNSATDALYIIHAADTDHRVKVNQRMGGGTWIYLGHYDIDIDKAAKGLVELKAYSSEKNAVVTADAVKVGGGKINVARRTVDADSVLMEYVTTDYPRFTGGARYWLQWAGAPDSVYTPSANVNDYNDDYRSRGLWVNWLTGGSSMLPGQDGLGIPVDLSFAFHSDAGTTKNDDIIGTLGIYCTVGDTLGNGSSRGNSRDLTDLVMTNIVNDVRTKYEPNWTRRGMWDKSYFEARVPAVPAMLLELLSHQNFADMKYGLDPRFRFDVSRAIYKGMLQFIAHRDGREYVVQPLAVNSFAISNEGNGHYTLSWQPTPDPLEPTADPTYYIVEQRRGDGAYTKIATVNLPKYQIKADEGDIYSYRIIAGNDGGVSFPSESLSLCYRRNAPEVLVVNGFTRLGAPWWFDSGEIAGFYNNLDGGVADVYDISYIGDMMEFRRDIPWMDDDAAGFGASRSNYETQVVAGNTFDYPYVHGRMIAAAGYGFCSSSLAAFVEGQTRSTAKIVDLILGKQRESAIGRGVNGTEFKTFTAELQQKITADTRDGISYLISGSYVASDLWDNPHSDEATMAADKKFAADVLGYQWRSGQATIGGEATTVQNPYGIPTHLTVDFVQQPNAESYAVESPDAVMPADKRGATFMRYTENNLPAGTLFDVGSYRTAILGFPLESVAARGNDADALLGQLLKFLNRK